MNNRPNGYLTHQEAEVALGASRATIFRLMHDDRIHPIKSLLDPKNYFDPDEIARVKAERGSKSRKTQAV